MALNLPRLPRMTPLTDPGGGPSVAFQNWWQNVVEALESQETAQDGILDDLATQLASINAVTASNAISASWISPSSVLTAADAGSDATITIASFTRLYDDGSSVSITGGNLTGLAYSTIYAVYYDDTTRENETPTFVATTDTGEARHNFVGGRHYIDTITTPAASDPPTSGGGYSPPGGGGDDGLPLP